MKRITLITTMLLAGLTAGHAEEYYKKADALFSMRPDPTKTVNPITEFGPVGMSLDLVKPNFMIRVKGIEPGSPAEKTGQFKPGTIIHSINGEKLADIDPRIQLGNMITKAEAADGRMTMVISDNLGAATREVVVQLQAMGAYSDTWPLNCPKSDRIVRDFADYLTRADANIGFSGIGMLFLVSTGDDAYLPTVRLYVHEQAQKKVGGYGWNIGYGGLAIAEYYLRTGDEVALKLIQDLVDHALEIETFGGWANKGSLGSPTYGGGGGHLNASGALVPGFLFLAKECGAKVDDPSLQRILTHWYRYAGRGNVPYGNGRPESGYTDNGKNGKLAFSMAAAAALTPDGENSIYARARDTNALFSFPSTSFMLHGHTGGGIGEIWRSAAMGLLKEKRPHLYRDFMDQRRWHYEMSRKYDGSFRILGGERYDNVSWGAGYALTYTIPRKTLRLTGAPPSKYSKTYQLPTRPWGTAEDDDFESIEAIAYPDGTRPDFSKDTLENGGGLALLKLRSGEISDEVMHKYIRHPQHTTRTYFAGQIAQRGEALVLELLGDKDARMRRLALDAVATTKGEMLTDKVFARVVAIIEDPSESWFVKDVALQLMGSASADRVALHIDTILPYFEHQEWWLQNAALTAVTPVVIDERCYKKVLPAIGKLLETNRLYNTLGPLHWGTLPNTLKKAPPEVAALAKKELKHAYTDYVDFKHELPGVEERVNPAMRDAMAKALVQLPGGYDMLFEISKQRSPGKALPYEDLYLSADPKLFSPELKKSVDELIETRLIPRYIAENRSYLLREMRNEYIEHGYYYNGARSFGLVDLYRRIGVEGFDWHDFGPKPTEMSWHYLNFDPPEKMAWDIPKSRYRPITLPEGMEGWYKPEFDPSTHGWKVGLQPFGAVDDKLVTTASECRFDFCRHGEPMKTLWEKEVMLMRGKFKLPEFKEGYRYRFVVGGMSHVGAGEGFKIWINGKEFMEKTEGVGKRGGGSPIGKFIDESWWSNFSGKEVDIAHMSFMSIHKGPKNRQLMIWLQEMKLPPVTQEAILHSATVEPMTSSAWQKLQDLDDADLDPEAGKFLWDGEHVSNPALQGKWKTAGYLNQLEEFDPAQLGAASRARIQQLNLTATGATDDPLWIWTDDFLLDLHRNQALKMVLKQIDGKDYLLIEDGGFNSKNGMNWQGPWFVMTRE